MDQVKTGLYIAEKRKQKNMTQAMLAEQIHVSKNAVSKWERGMNLPEVSSMPQLCQILGITLNELFAGEDIKEEVLPFTADQNLLEALQNSSFSLQERIAYFKKEMEKRASVRLHYLCDWLVCFDGCAVYPQQGYGNDSDCWSIGCTDHDRSHV